jgi:hypothetical protein
VCNNVKILRRGPPPASSDEEMEPHCNASFFPRSPISVEEIKLLIGGEVP